MSPHEMAALEKVERWLAVLVNTSVAPEIGAWRDAFVDAHKHASTYLHEREHGTPPMRAVEHAERAVV